MCHAALQPGWDDGRCWVALRTRGSGGPLLRHHPPHPTEPASPPRLVWLQDWFRCEGGLYCKAPDKEAGDVGTCRRCPPNPPQEHWVHTCDPAVQWTPEEMNRPHAAAPQAEGAP